LPFDEKIPDAADVTDENFYDVFGKCFQNNSRFSEKKPVPNIGDANTPMNEVSKFYKFWDNFKTWREFSQYDEYDTEDA
jgi:DnaJ family protein C protein 2